MNKDPYVVLGVDRNITDEELKKVYHDLVKKNHPDRFQDPELKKAASEKTAAINAAYDEIVEMRKNGGSAYGRNGYGSYGQGTYGQSNYGTGGSYYGNTYTGSSGSAEHRELYNQARVFINNGRYEEATALLSHIEDYERDAEWYYLYGCVMAGRGRPMDAGQCFDRACNMDPDNPEYESARRQFRNQTSYNTAHSWNSDPCNDGCSNCCNLLCLLRCCCC